MQPRDLSNAGQKSRELTTPPEPPNKLVEMRTYWDCGSLLDEWFPISYVKSKFTDCNRHIFSSKGRTYILPSVKAPPENVSIPRSKVESGDTKAGDIWWAKPRFCGDCVVVSPENTPYVIILGSMWVKGRLASSFNFCLFKVVMHFKLIIIVQKSE